MSLINRPYCRYSLHNQLFSIVSSIENITFYIRIFPIYSHLRMSIYFIWLTPLYFLALLTGIRSMRGRQTEAVQELWSSSAEKHSRPSKQQKKESGSGVLYWKRSTDTIKFHKPLLSFLPCPSVLHIWGLCLNSCNIKAHDVIYTVLCSRRHMVLDDDKWTQWSYDKFKTQSQDMAMFIVQAFV